MMPEILRPLVVGATFLLFIATPLAMCAFAIVGATAQIWELGWPHRLALLAAFVLLAWLTGFFAIEIRDGVVRGAEQRAAGALQCR